MIDRARAIEIASGVHAMDIPPDVAPIVTETADWFVVVWPFTLPPHTFGPDYWARVTIDRRTGDVVEVLVAS